MKDELAKRISKETPSIVDSLLGYAAKTIKDNLTTLYLSLGSAGLVEPMEVRFLQGKIDGLKFCLETLREQVKRMNQGIEDDEE